MRPESFDTSGTALVASGFGPIANRGWYAASDTKPVFSPDGSGNGQGRQVR